MLPHRRADVRLLQFLSGLLLPALSFAAEPSPKRMPSLAEVVAASRDVWGELAMREPNGPSYEFFEPLLPPPRYVHADFRYYPLVLERRRRRRRPA